MVQGYPAMAKVIVVTFTVSCHGDARADYALLGIKSGSLACKVSIFIDSSWRTNLKMSKFTYFVQVSVRNGEGREGELAAAV